MAANKQSPLANRSEFLNFPVDEYVSACIISYQVASLPPSKFSKTTDPVPSVRFLLAGRVKNTEGEDVVVRKWTSWMTLSYNEKSKMAQVFKDVPNLEFLITDDEEGGALWETPLKIMLEKSKDGKYSNIIRIKVSDDKSVLDICYTGKSILSDGTETFAPYRKVGAYGKLVFLEVAVNKEEDGVKFYSGEDLIENPEETDDD